MADDTRDFKPEAVDAVLGDMKLEESVSQYGELDTANGNYEDFPTPGGLKMSRSTTPAIQNSASQSPLKKQSASQTPKSEDGESVEVVGGEIIVTNEPGKRPKLQRKASQKIPVRPPSLYNDLPDATAEATAGFQVIKDCIYGSKYMGSTDVDMLDCDCSEEFRDGQNQACIDDSVCINRATKLECLIGNCNCGAGCQNQRFQRKQWADVSVIKTERKDYGLRTNTDLEAGDFVYEYLGEVINEPARRRRAIQYAEVDGLQHFYFMHLTGNEIIDATKKGNLGRFCNHSCNPNCYVDKWVVGEKLRMGIFAKRHIKAGEELVFDYNADRYGSEATPCYCGEPNCSGWIGGKIQTGGRATNLSLSHATIEALGIDDGDGWDTAVAKKPRKKKTGEDDEEYVSQVQPKGLDEDGVRKVMATLMQCKERWIAVKLLSRIQRCDDDRVRNRVVQMHGYQILRTTLTTWKDDNDVILQVLDVLYKFPRLTRNKIQDSKIETTVETLISCEHEDVAFEAKRLLEEWGKLQVAYRIPRKKFDPNAVSIFERRNADRAEEVTKSPQPAAVVAPTGPRGGIPSRSSNFNNSRPLPRRNFNNSNNGALPPGWFAASDQSGNTYYYSKAGSTTWQRPTIPAAEPPPPPKLPPKSVQTAKALQDIIDSITKPDPNLQTPQSAPTADSTPKEKKAPTEKWRSLPQDKQMKLYENTLFPHIKYVMQKFTKQLSKEDLKKFAKEVGKKLVASDFKNNRVEDPTKISEKQEKKVKQYVRTYFEKAVQKKKELDQKKKEKEACKLANGNAVSKSIEEPKSATKDNADEDDADEADETMDLTPNTPVDFGVSPHPSIPATPSGSDNKRKRDEMEMGTPGGSGGTGEDSESNKRLKEESSTPPPPPPPPADSPLPLNDSMEMQSQEETDEQKELKRQEEELMRENEEAMMMDMDGSLRTEETKAGVNGILAPHSLQNPGSVLEKVNGNTNGVQTGLGPNNDAAEQVMRRR